MEPSSRLPDSSVLFCTPTSVVLVLNIIIFKFQVSLQIDLTHLQEFDPELAEAVVANARRYNLLASDAVWELIPDYREEIQ